MNSESGTRPGQNLMHCDSESLQQYLSGDSTPEQCVRIERHLSDCAACQKQLGLQAAPDEFWNATAEVLADPVDLLDCSDDRALPLQSADENFGMRITADDSTADTTRAIITSEMLLTHLRSWCDPPPSDQEIGRIDHYLIEEIIGHGGMGIVLRATDFQLGRTVAIKTLLQPTAIDTRSRDRLIREAQAVASLKHEHVVDLHSIQHWRDVPYIVMPFVEGGTLDAYSDRHSFSIEQILDVARQIASALAAAHQRNLVHRDIKPSNILLQDNLNHVLLADFGLARVGGDFTVTQSGMAPGTPQWMSPEQAFAGTIDHRSDQFSLGSLMYWMSTGKCPFESESCYATLMKLVNEPAAPIGDLNPEVPDYMGALIGRMMMKSPQDRFSNIRHVGQLIDACLAHVRDLSQCIPDELRLSGSRPKIKRPVQRSRLRTVGIIGATCVTFASLTFAWLKRPPGLPAATAETFNAVAPNIGVSPTLQTLQAVANRPDPSAGSAPNDDPASFQVERYGPLDEIELSNAIDDFQRDQNVRYWLRRLAYLPADEIPPELIPMIQVSANDDDDVTTAELALVILEKNPFVEVAPQDQPEKPVAENPFIMIEE